MAKKIAFAALDCFLLPSAAQAIKMAMAVGRLCKSVKNSCAAAIFYCCALLRNKQPFPWPRPEDWLDGPKIAFASFGYFLLPREAQAIKMAMAVGQLCQSVKNSCAAAVFYCCALLRNKKHLHW